MLPDSGVRLKQRFLPDFPQVPYRIEVQRYACAGKWKIEIRNGRNGDGHRRAPIMSSHEPVGNLKTVIFAGGYSCFGP